MGSTARALALATLLAPLASKAQTPAPLPQIEQARQFAPTQLPGREAAAPAAEMPAMEAAESPDDAFGAQVLLKKQEKPRPFTAFAEVSAFFTNNVALVDRAPEEDKFLVFSAGGAFSKPITPQLRLDLGFRAAVYRYAEYRELDFQSTDLNAGVAWAPAPLRGAELLLRYTYTNLTAAERIREFYKNHAVLVGVQKIHPLARAHAVYAGATAQWSWADPREAVRDEYAAFAGYRVQLTHKIDADLIYRYARYVYREIDGREDDNQTVSLTVRYAATDWLSLSASGFYSDNRSSNPLFDYDVLNAGIALQLVGRF